MKDNSDIALIQGVLEGDIPAFETLVRRYEKPLLAFCYRLVWSHETAEEVVQDTFFSVYRHINQVDQTRKFSSYLFAVAKNTAISRLRKNKQTYALLDEDAMTDDMTLYEDLAKKETSDMLHRAVASLDPKFGNVLSLYYFSEMSYEEIGKRLKLPVNTVRTHLRRGRAALKQALQ